MITEQERRAAILDVAEKIYTATGQDAYDVVERLTRPPIVSSLVAARIMSQPIYRGPRRAKRRARKKRA